MSMMSDASERSLVLANLVPVAGVLFLGWDAGLLLVLFWAENLVAGFYNVLKMLFPPRGGAQSLVLSGFFILHYGCFCGVHGLFVYGVLKGVGDMAQMTSEMGEPVVFAPLRVGGRMLSAFYGEYGMELLIPVAALLLSHGVSFVENHLKRREDAGRPPALLLFAPYPRVLLLHAALLLCMLPVIFLGWPRLLLVVLMVLKVGLDLHLHRKSHRA